LGAETTASVFGRELHSYVITDAIRDEKVLKFKVDYNDVRPQFRAIETEQDEQVLTAAENKQALLHPDRIREITGYILKNFPLKTHRAHMGAKGFNAMFAVSSVDAAKAYYEAFRELQKDAEEKKRLKVATIFSFAANEEQDAVGDIPDESFEVSALNSSAKEFLSAAIGDYNAAFKTNYGVDSKGFQNYYRDLAQRVKKQEVDLLIVVGMFLTGFDAPTLNTMFVDKNLRYHGLLQAFSRTNRIYDATKTFGNIVTFRDLEQSTVDSITLFSIGSRAKESLIVDFINQTNLDDIGDKANVIDAFFKFAQAEQKCEAEELIQSEALNQEEARRYIKASLKREYATENGTALNATLPKMSPLNPQYKTKKQTVFEKISAFVEKFKGVGGDI